jgi:hypothetical protein
MVSGDAAKDYKLAVMVETGCAESRQQPPRRVDVYILGKP